MELIKGADKKFYRAYDPLKQRTVGCLYIEVKGASKQARILREIDTLRELHLLGIPHVPKLYGVAGTYNEDSSIRNLSLYMEDYNGGDLIELPTHFPAIDRARLTARVAISVLETLKGCHALGIVHGDIKLDNILVKLCQVEMEGGATQKVIREICLGDWGFSTTKTSTREDKCAYRGSMVTVAPEVMEKDVEAGPASDIYALGLSLFCLLEGRSARPRRLADARGPAAQEMLKAWLVHEGEGGNPFIRYQSVIRSGQRLSYLEHGIMQMIHPNPECRGTAEGHLRWIGEGLKATLRE